MNPDEIGQALQAVAVEQASMREQLRTLFRIFDEQKELTKSVGDLALSVRDLANAQKNTADNVCNIQTDVDELKSKPAKRWESLMAAIIAAIVSGVIGFFIARLVA